MVVKYYYVVFFFFVYACCYVFEWNEISETFDQFLGPEMKFVNEIFCFLSSQWFLVQLQAAE